MTDLLPVPTLACHGYRHTMPDIITVTMRNRNGVTTIRYKITRYCAIRVSFFTRRHEHVAIHPGATRRPPHTIRHPPPPTGPYSGLIVPWLVP